MLSSGSKSAGNASFRKPTRRGARRLNSSTPPVPISRAHKKAGGTVRGRERPEFIPPTPALPPGHAEQVATPPFPNDTLSCHSEFQLRERMPDAQAARDMIGPRQQRILAVGGVAIWAGRRFVP